jgi:hypothetical protein
MRCSSPYTIAYGLYSHHDFVLLLFGRQHFSWTENGTQTNLISGIWALCLPLTYGVQNLNLSYLVGYTQPYTILEGMEATVAIQKG